MTIDLSKLKTTSIHDRKSKLHSHDLGLTGSETIEDLMESLPKQLAANALRKWCDAIVTARRLNRPVIAAVGAHVVKTGCSPYIVDWIRRGIITGIIMSGATAIHDIELAIAGHTSEDVADQLQSGEFGTVREVADAFICAVRVDMKVGEGLGQALGRYLEYEDRSSKGVSDDFNSSILYAAYLARCPCTVHVTLGTDVVHIHPTISGAELGASSMIDFRKACNIIAGMAGGVWMNLGSAVILPEVFLKGVAVARNLGYDLSGLTTVDLDMVRSYRARLNMERAGGTSLAITGHHEIMIPLIHAAVAAKIRG